MAFLSRPQDYRVLRGATVLWVLAALGLVILAFVLP